MRRKDREITAPEEIEAIIRKTRILHLGLHDGEFPYIVPLHYGYEQNEESGQYMFYMHGAREGHKLDLIRRNPHVCVELDCDEAIVSGGDIPCAYGAVYASVIGRGNAEIVEDEKEKIHGLELLMRHQTGREFAIAPQMASSVCVIKVTLIELTAKSRKPAPGKNN